MNGHELFKGMFRIDTAAVAAPRSLVDFARRYGNRIANAAALGPLTSSAPNRRAQPVCRPLAAGGCG